MKTDEGKCFQCVFDYQSLKCALQEGKQGFTASESVLSWHVLKTFNEIITQTAAVGAATSF